MEETGIKLWTKFRNLAIILNENSTIKYQVTALKK